jgi:ribonuclease HI
MQYKGFFDGSSKGNPGPSGCSWQIEDDKKNTIAYNNRISETDRTNNYAEYLGLIELLNYIRTQDNIVKIDIYGDSKLVVEQVNGRWKCKSNNLKPLWKTAVTLFEYLTTTKYLTINWVPREENTKADSLAQKGVLE